jgi:hypothetical protein
MPSPPKSPTIGIRYISDAVKSDHRLLERLYAKLTSPPSSTTPATATATSPEDKRALCSRLAWELARHLVAMELFIFPGTARRARQGSQAAQERQHELAQLREEVRALCEASKKAAAGDEEKLNTALETLGRHLGRHIHNVERVDLVNIENVLSGQESEDLARDFETTVFFIPHGVRGDEEEEDDWGVKAPYKSVEALLDSQPGELRAAMKKFPRE